MTQGPDPTSWDLLKMPHVTLAVCFSLLRLCLCFFSKEEVQIELKLSLVYTAVLTVSFLPILTFLYNPRQFFLEVSMSSVNLNKIGTTM